MPPRQAGEDVGGRVALGRGEVVVVVGWVIEGGVELDSIDH